jgi:hypothetical protein
VPLADERYTVLAQSAGGFRVGRSAAWLPDVQRRGRLHDEEGWTLCEGSVSAIDADLSLRIADLPTEKAGTSAASIWAPR